MPAAPSRSIWAKRSTNWVVGFGVEDLGIERRHGLFDGRCCLPGLGLQREEAHPPVVSDSIQDLAEVEAVFDAHELVAEAS